MNCRALLLCVVLPFALVGSAASQSDGSIQNLQNQLTEISHAQDAQEYQAEQLNTLIEALEASGQLSGVAITILMDEENLTAAQAARLLNDNQLRRATVDIMKRKRAGVEQDIEALKDRRAALSQQLTDERLRRQNGNGATAIQVLAGTYGGNCPAVAFSTDRGNVTPALSEACDGKTSCSYVVDYHTLGDPSFGCAKNYVAEWTCGDSGRVRRAEAAPEAGYGSRVELTCAATSRSAQGTTINDPMMGDLPLDVCRIFENECGKPAADAYCAANGFAESADFGTETVPKTRVIGDGRVCEPPHPCGRMSSVTCRQRAGDDGVQ